MLQREKCITNQMEYNIDIGAELGGCSRCMCTPTFMPSPKVYSIKWGENSPKFPVPALSAPALFRAHWRQCILLYIIIMVIKKF